MTHLTNTPNYQSLEKQIAILHKEILKNPFAEKLTNLEMAQRLNISESYFKKIFKRMYGIAPYQIYLETKFEYAKWLLQSGDYKVKEIANLLGYSQSAKFVQKFREHVGKTPKNYAKSIKIL
ncbi:MAG: AraC family transcriptional regulator [Spirosomataceae bacterium]